MRRLPVSALLALALATPVLFVPASTAGTPVVTDVTLTVAGTPARGLMALPADGAAPTAIVVFAHGHGNTVEAWRTHLVEAASHGAVVITMDYAPEFDIDRGAAETIAAAEHLRALYPGLTVYLLGVSMGGEVSGVALAETHGVFDYWVDAEGLTNLFETWLEAKAVGNSAQQEIERDTGGSPDQAPDAYVARSPALRAAEIAASGVRAVVVVHDLNDGLVPYNQARELAPQLSARGLPLDFYTVVRGACSEPGTTLTGDFGAPNPACLAGHAWEGSSTHPVMTTALGALWQLMDGTNVPPAYREFVVDAPGA